MTNEVGHLAAGDPCGDLDRGHLSVGRRDELRERDPVPEAERRDGPLGGPLGERELVRVDRRRVDVDPADAEADTRRPQPVGERQEAGLAAACHDDPVHLRAVDERLEDRLACGRLGERRVEMGLEVSGRLDPEETPLAAGVDRLQHGRKPDRGDRSAALGEAADRGERRLRDSLLRQRPPHGDLVGHAVRHLRPDGRQPEPLGHGCDDGNCPVGRDGERAVDLVPPRDLLDGVDVHEVDDLRHVGQGEPGRIRIPVDCDDAEAAVACLGDRAALVAPRADEEDARHGAMLDGRSVTAVDPVAARPGRRSAGRRRGLWSDGCGIAPSVPIRRSRRVRLEPWATARDGRRRQVRVRTAEGATSVRMATWIGGTGPLGRGGRSPDDERSAAAATCGARRREAQRGTRPDEERDGAAEGEDRSHPKTVRPDHTCGHATPADHDRRDRHLPSPVPLTGSAS